jgi:hypothetical protein
VRALGLVTGVPLLALWVAGRAVDRRLALAAAPRRRRPGSMAAMRGALLALLGLALAAAPARAGERLPPGPPWQRDFVTAHAEAARTGKPLFVYFTKTY